MESTSAAREPAFGGRFPQVESRIDDVLVLLQKLLWLEAHVGIHEALSTSSRRETSRAINTMDS